MSSTSGQHVMDQVLVPPEREILFPYIEKFLKKLADVQWEKLVCGSVDEAIELVVSDVCMDLVDFLSLYIIDALKQGRPDVSDSRLPRTPSKSSRSSRGSDGSQDTIVSTEQVLDCLGDVIPSTIAEVMRVPADICSRSKEEVTELVVKEVTERVNSKLSQSSGGGGSSRSSSKGRTPLASKSCTGRPTKGKNPVVRALKTLAANMTCRSGSCKKPNRQKLTENDEEPDESEESSITLVTPLEEEGTEISSSGDGFVDVATAGVMMILEEQGSDIAAIDYNVDLLGAIDVIVKSANKDKEKAASEIVKTIMEDLHLEEDGTPKRKPQLKERRSCWKKVGNKIKAFFSRRFAKESILDFVAKLERKRDSLPPTKRRSSMKLLIEAVDSLLEDMILPEDSGEDAQDTCLYKVLASDISNGKHKVFSKQLGDVVSHHLYPGKKQMQQRLDINTEVDVFMKLMWNWLQMQVQQHQRKMDIVNVAVKEIKKCMAVLTERPSVEGGNIWTPALEAAAASITDGSAISVEATAPQAQGWDQHWCDFMVIWLVNKILKKMTLELTPIQPIIMTLQKMLWAETANSDIAVKPSVDLVERTVKAVHKDLCKRMGGAKKMCMSLLLKDATVYEIIVETVKRHLVTPQKTSGIKGFFTSVFKTVGKQLAACFRCGHKDKSSSRSNDA